MNAQSDEFTVQLVEASLVPSDVGRTIVGEIWVSLDGIDFPSKRWRDFPLPILEWWGRALHDLCIGEIHCSECDFMHGPYSFIVERAGVQEARVAFIDSSSLSSKCVASRSIVLAALCNEVIKASAALLDYIDRTEFVGTDAVALRRAHNELQDVLDKTE